LAQINIGEKVHTESLTAPKNGRRTTVDAIAEDTRRAQTAFGMDTDADELQTALSSLRGKSLPRQIAELAIEIGRLKKQVRELREYSNATGK